MEGPLEVAPGVHAFGDGVINFYAVTEGDRLTVIDAGLPGFRDRFLADLAALGRTPADVEAVVLTHFDDDHTGLAPMLQEAGARVLIHPADQEKIAKPGPKRGEASLRHVLPALRKRTIRRIFVHMLRNGGTKSAKIERSETFADGDVLDVPGRPRIIHTPGHTYGHCAFLLEDRGVLVAGDQLLTHPWITGGDDRIATMPRELNEDNAAVRASLDVIERVDAGIVLVGHGEPWRHGAAEAARAARG